MGARLYIVFVLATLFNCILAKVYTHNNYCTSVRTGYRDRKIGFSIKLGPAFLTNNFNTWGILLPNLDYSCPDGVITGSVMTVCESGAQASISYLSANRVLVTRQEELAEGHATVNVTAYCRKSVSKTHPKIIYGSTGKEEKIFVWPEA